MTEHYRIENGVIKYYPQGVPNSAPCEVAQTQQKKTNTGKKKK